MKRLLSYLFIVLGLGLTFSVKAKSEILKIRYNSALCPGCDTDVLRFNSTEDFEIWKNKKTSKKTWMWTNSIPDFNWNNHEKEIGIKIITIDSSKDIDLYEKVYSNLRNWYFAEDFWNHKFFYQIEVSKLDEIINFKKSQIAKAEETKKEKIKTILNLAFCVQHNDYYGLTSIRLNKCIEHETEVDWSDFRKNYQIICFNKSKDKDAIQKLFQLKSAYKCSELLNDNIVQVKYDGQNFYYGEGISMDYATNPKIVKTKITKAEPSQPQKVPEKEIEIVFCYHYGSNPSELEALVFINKPNACMENRTYNFEEVTNYVNLKICAEPGKEKGTYIGSLKKKSKKCKNDEVEFNYDGKNFIWDTEETQIAKAEPSQTQKIKLDLIFCLNDKERSDFGVYIRDNVNGKCPNTGYETKHNLVNTIYEIFNFDPNKMCYLPNNPKGIQVLWTYGGNCKALGGSKIKYDSAKNEFYTHTKNTQNQIAKVEPSQTQEQSKETNVKLAMTAKVYDDQYLDSGQHTTAFNFSHKAKLKLNDKKALNQLYKYVFNNTIDRCKLLNKTFTTGICTVTSIKFTDLNNPKNNKSIVNKKGFKKTALFFDILNNDNTKIAGAEPTITPKKKVKVAKKELKKEEFKPENKDIDYDAPVIEIAESITVDSQTYTLKGKVKDKSKLYLEANGRPLKISKRGNFELEGFVVDPDEGDQIKIVAIDQWKNKSEKTINIKVEFKEIADLRTYEKPNPNKIKVKKDKNKIAIIIGIEKYKTLKNIDAPYANRDANAFRAYANRALGIPNKNIKVLIDENATRGETLKALTLWLPQAARGMGKDIYIFFAGHGLASDDGKNLYILPQDGDAALLQYTAISRLEIFELISKVQPKSVTMFFDTCYSGQTRDEEMLVAGLRPIRLAAEEQDAPNNFTIFTASNYDQTSGSINEAEHGIFSYYLMKGMEGQADSNEDKKITNGELIAYLKQNVTEEAFINNRQQEPMLSGDPDKVLISYR